MKKTILLSILTSSIIFGNEIQGEIFTETKIIEKKKSTCLDYYKPIANPNFVHCTNTGLTTEDMEKLKTVTHANAMFLEKNKITDLSPLSGLKSIDGELLLNDNEIISLEPIKGLESVKVLNIKGNTKITDLSPLNNLKIDKGGKFITDTKIYDKKLNHYSLICEDIRNKSISFEGEYSSICDGLKPL